MPNEKGAEEPSPKDTSKRGCLNPGARWIVILGIIAAIIGIPSGILGIESFFNQPPKSTETTHVVATPTSIIITTATNSSTPSGVPTAVPTATRIPVPTATPSPSFFDSEFPDNNIPKTIQGPAIVEWADPGCGLFALNKGESFTWNSDGHYWLYHNQQSLDNAYPSHKSAYFGKSANAGCTEGRP